jgi:predicted ATPase
MRTFVITGGPCTGKTTLIDNLKQQGFPILEEIARKVNQDHPDWGMAERQVEMAMRQEDVEWRERYTHEQHDRGNIPVFLDRGIFC